MEAAQDLAMSEQSIDGCATVSTLFCKRVHQHPDKIALREKDFGIWNEYSWTDYQAKVRAIALGLMHFGVARGEVVGIIGKNRPNWVWSEIACHAEVAGSGSVGPPASQQASDNKDRGDGECDTHVAAQWTPRRSFLESRSKIKLATSRIQYRAPSLQKAIYRYPILDIGCPCGARIVKVLLLIHRLTHGGAQRQLVELARGLKARGHDVSVVTFY